MKKFLFVAVLTGLLFSSWLNAVEDSNQSVKETPQVIKHTIPYLNMSENYKTFIKVFNNGECEIVGKVIVYGDNGAHNDEYSVFPIITSLKPKHSRLIFAENIRQIAENMGIYLPNAFGMDIFYSCKGDKVLKRDKIFTLVLQKSPEGQRVVPVYRNFDEINPQGSGKMIIPHIFHEEYSNIGGFKFFIKILNTSFKSAPITIKAYTSEGKEFRTNWILTAKKATLIRGKELYNALGVPYNVSLALVIEVPEDMEFLYPMAVQKTYNGPRVLKVYKIK